MGVCINVQEYWGRRHSMGIQHTGYTHTGYTHTGQTQRRYIQAIYIHTGIYTYRAYTYRVDTYRVRIYRMTGNLVGRYFGGLLKICHLPKFTLAVEPVLP